MKLQRETRFILRSTTFPSLLLAVIWSTLLARLTAPKLKAMVPACVLSPWQTPSPSLTFTLESRCLSCICLLLFSGSQFLPTCTSYMPSGERSHRTQSRITQKGNEQIRRRVKLHRVDKFGRKEGVIYLMTVSNKMQKVDTRIRPIIAIQERRSSPNKTWNTWSAALTRPQTQNGGQTQKKPGPLGGQTN